MKNTVVTLIRLGFEPARFFKRSVWVKVERVMDYLVNTGEVIKLNGEIKYGTNHGYSESDLDRWADSYLNSPLSNSLETMKALSKTLGLPLNSKKLLNQYMNLK